MTNLTHVNHTITETTPVYKYNQISYCRNYYQNYNSIRKFSSYFPSCDTRRVSHSNHGNKDTSTNLNLHTHTDI